MKKIIFTFIALGGLSFSVNATNCHSYAQAACAYESSYYGVMSFPEYQQAYSFYYNYCIDNNGNVSPPTML